jgi:hypothetical protein
MDIRGASLRQIVRDIWSNKPLAITLLVGVAAVIYILYKNGGLTAPTATSTSTPTGTTTFNNSYTQVISSGPTPPAPAPGSPAPAPMRVQTVFPAPKGSLQGPSGAGKGDTNWWAYTIPARGATLDSIAKMAKWTVPQLVNYRNNASIFAQMGIDTTNPNSVVPGGWVISV